MYSKRRVREYCCEDPSKIQNHDKASADKTTNYEIHHLLEDDGYTADQLKAMGRYYSRPAIELIFLTKSEHIKRHQTGSRHSMYGKTGELSHSYGKKGIDSYAYKWVCPLRLAYLRNKAGMSYRAIAREIVVSRVTVINRLKELDAVNTTTSTEKFNH